MIFNRTPHPKLLTELMREDLWPNSHEQAIQQNLKKRISPDIVKSMVDSESEIFLYPNPKQTLAEEHKASKKRQGNHEFLLAYEKTLDQISPELALFVADFGAGSDAPIALDYRSSKVDPSVIGLKWDDDLINSSDNAWVTLSPSFSEFVEKLKLRDLPPFKR